MIDPSIPSVQKCLEGMRAEGAGNAEEAKRFFTEAWDLASTDYERAIAAHYLARQQPSPEEELYWNQIALDNARDVPEAAGFLPSLLGSVGLSLEKLGKNEDAVRHFHEAEMHFSVLSDDAYGDLVRTMVTNGLARLGN
ncbi:MAG TPA: hypothetical protein VK171_05435 [Fimbriimonas sp.]|nr:hypothetical protein [Fimbriimonas sp.]